MIDLEAHGGLYTLHSHMNHSCCPNVSMRHLDQRAALSRITVIARRDIAIGEELAVTYVDPSLGAQAALTAGCMGIWAVRLSDVASRRRGKERTVEMKVRKRVRQKSDRIWRPGESSKQDWVSCNYCKITCCFSKSFHRDYDDTEETLPHKQGGFSVQSQRNNSTVSKGSRHAAERHAAERHATGERTIVPSFPY